MSPSVKQRVRGVGERLGFREHRLFWIVLAILTIPIIVWLVQRVSGGWVLAGDEALTAIRAHDAWTGNWPLVGMRSTSTETDPNIMAYHPGPMEFYLIGLPYLLSGWSTVGLLIGCAALLLFFVGVAVWSGYRASGTPGLIAMSAAVVLLYGLFDSVLILPWNPWLPVMGLLTCLALAWRMMLGDQGLWPLFMFCISYVGQAHLGITPIAGLLGLFLLVQVIVRWRRDPRHEVRRRELKWAIGVGVLCWLGPIMNVVLFTPSNVSEIYALSRADKGGSSESWDALVHTTYMIFPWAREARDARMPSLWGTGVLLIALAIVALTWWERRTRRHAPRDLEKVAHVGVVLGILAVAATYWSGTRTGGGLRILFLDYLMAAPLFMTVMVFLWLVVRGREDVPEIWAKEGRWAAVVALTLAVLAAAVTPSSYQRDFYELGYQKDQDQAVLVMDRLMPVLDEEPWADLPVVLEARGFTAWGGISPAVSAALVADGREVYFGSPWPRRADNDHRRPHRVAGDFVRVRIDEYVAHEEIREDKHEAENEFTVDFLGEEGGIIRVRSWVEKF